MSVSARFIAAAAIVPLLFGLVSCASKEEIRKPIYKRPASKASSSKSGARYHKLRRGETLYSIAKRYGVSVSALKKANSIRNVRDIEIGTKIYIPPRSSVSSKKKKKKSYSRPKSYSSKTKVRFIWPVKRVDISSGFGIHSNKRHDGLDLRGKRGSPIFASARGKVIFSGTGPSGYGKMVIVKHDSKTITLYAHNDRNLVTEGQAVKQGQQIATIGRSGRATGYHVHFEIRVNRKAVNPTKYLPRRRG